MKDFLVVIPARGGSKGIPNKNIKYLGGKPLITYSIDIAKKITANENICVSTDSEKIKKVAENFEIDVPFLRPSHLATDTASSQDVLLHAINYYESRGKSYKGVILLQPTSPFRKLTDLQKAIKLFNKEIDMVVSVKISHANPYFNLFEEEQGYLKKSKPGIFTRRQDLPNVYEFNGAVYVININSLKKTKIASFTKVKKIEMDEESSLDLDTPFDWKLCESILKRKNKL